MPPKKKKGGKKKKKKDDGVLTVDDKYQKTLDEIAALKDHLVARKEIGRRAQTASEEWRSRMEEARENLTTNQQDQRDISSELTRQYKTMQTEMGFRMHQLENELARTRKQLEQTEADLKKTQDDKARLIKEKDQQIDDLTLKINTMGTQYESVLDDALTALVEKLGLARSNWSEKSSLLQSRNKQTLLEFGLNPLDL